MLSRELFRVCTLQIHRMSGIGEMFLDRPDQIVVTPPCHETSADDYGVRPIRLEGGPAAKCWGLVASSKPEVEPIGRAS